MGQARVLAEPSRLGEESAAAGRGWPEPSGTTCRNPAKLLAALMPSVGEHPNCDGLPSVPAVHELVSASFLLPTKVRFPFVPKPCIEDRTDRG